MRIFAILDETPFFHPQFVDGMLSKLKSEFVGVGIVTKVPAKNNINSYLMRHCFFLRPTEWIQLLRHYVQFYIRDFWSAINQKPRENSVEGICVKHGVPSFKIETDVNRIEYLDRIRALNPDIIVSSNSLIFRETLLKIPKICCINRHSALLPSYGGLWPVFQAIRSGETQLGVSVHVMNSGIDKGTVISQIPTPIYPEDSVFTLYHRCFALSIDAVLQAIEKIRINDFSAVKNTYKSSYYSFPTRLHWREFRTRGKRFV